MSKFTDKQKKVEKGVLSGYQKIEDGVVSSYKKIEDGVVAGYKKIEDKFVETFLNDESSDDANEDIGGNRTN